MRYVIDVTDWCNAFKCSQTCVKLFYMRAWSVFYQEFLGPSRLSNGHVWNSCPAWLSNNRTSEVWILPSMVLTPAFWTLSLLHFSFLVNLPLRKTFCWNEFLQATNCSVAKMEALSVLSGFVKILEWLLARSSSLEICRFSLLTPRVYVPRAHISPTVHHLCLTDCCTGLDTNTT